MWPSPLTRLDEPSSLQGNINSLRKIVKRMNESEAAYVTEALKFERDVEQIVEGCATAVSL